MNNVAISQLSIKNLTLLGFSLVAIPLAIALIFSASQVNSMSNDSEDAIIDIKVILDKQQLLKRHQVNMERTISQYLVLREQPLKKTYTLQGKQILNALSDLKNASHDNKLDLIIVNYEQQLTELLTAVIAKSTQIERDDKDLLTPIQNSFNALSLIHHDIVQRSHELTGLYIKRIKADAKLVNSVILKSLLVIPLSLGIAIIFIIMITKPLRALTSQIDQLQQGHFNEKISLTGAPEIQEIAQALDNMRTRLHALELQKSSFIRHISHELKTPLAAIREGTELLYDNSVGPLNNDQQEITQITKVNVNKLQQHIEDLLAFNIVLDSTSLQDSEKLIISEEITLALEQRKLDIKRKQINIAANLGEFYLYSNKKQLNVIMDNILSNAIKYSPEGGTMTITCSLENTLLTIDVCDQGEGISKQHINKVFNAFYQGPAPKDSALKGSGLGLTIVHELLQRLNGSVHITSSTTPACSHTKVQICLPRAYQLGDSTL